MLPRLENVDSLRCLLLLSWWRHFPLFVKNKSSSSCTQEPTVGWSACWARWIHSTSSYYICLISFSILFSYTLNSPKLSHSCFLLKFFMHFLYLIIQIWEYQLYSSLECDFLHLPVTLMQKFPAMVHTCYKRYSCPCA